MTNFAQPVSMPCTEEQYNRDLKEGLEKLVYKAYMLSWNFDFICTNYQHQQNVFSDLGMIATVKNNRYFIPEYNPELFLAIAGMTNEQYGIAGEWWMCYNAFSVFEKDKLYKAYKSLDFPKALIVEGERINGRCGMNLHHFRKATLSELIANFTKKDVIYTLEDLRQGKVVCVNDGTKEHRFKFGDEVLAWDDDSEDKARWTFIANIGGDYPYLLGTAFAEDLLRQGEGTTVNAFRNISPIPEPLKITRQEIAEWKGTDNFEIV